MKTTEFTTTILKPEDGCYLTQKADVDILNRTLAKVIALGKGDNADNYVEIDEEQYNTYKTQKEAEQKKQAEAVKNSSVPDVSTKN